MRSFNQIVLLKKKGLNLFVDDPSRVGRFTWIELVFFVSVLNLLVHFPRMHQKILCYIISIPSSYVRNEHDNMVLPHCHVSVHSQMLVLRSLIYSPIHNPKPEHPRTLKVDLSPVDSSSLVHRGCEGRALCQVGGWILGPVCLSFISACMISTYGYF